MNKPASTPPRKALGRGLEALLPGAGSRTTIAPNTGDGVSSLALTQIRPNQFQPRKVFEPEALAELAASIRAQGVLQPILVRPVPGGTYELIAGERRFRAAQLAGLEKIPALIRTFGDERSLAVALIENLQRADLDPVEQARAFKELSDRFHLTQEQIAQQTGKERTTVANLLRLLRLEPTVLELLRSRALSPGQARPLIGLDPEPQIQLAQRIAAEHWPARRVEEHVAQLGRPAPPPKPAPVRDPNERDAEEQLARALGARVQVKTRGRKRDRGSITIEYADLEDFQRLFDRLCL